ncbi:hypothetical protein TrVE_jg9814 [Triparma verrucosa]|uniref:Ion transport domain-containing protein n=1 Tax=Triparma verrucosa TaxID=1606542 RepID=A0A9W7C453_9STRA|nr:hypothetical protein TrVE_jg9814 [Triparma verrucosa]
MSELQMSLSSSVRNPLNSTKHVIGRRISTAQTVDWDAIYFEQILYKSEVNLKTGKASAIWSGGVSYDGRFIVAGSHNGLFVRDMLDGQDGLTKKVAGIDELGGGVTALAFDPDKGKSVVYLGSSKGKIVKIDLQKGSLVWEFGDFEQGASMRISSLALSKDSETLVSIYPNNENAQASIWSLPKGGKPVKVKDLDVKAPSTGTCAMTPHSRDSGRVNYMCFNSNSLIHVHLLVPPYNKVAQIGDPKEGAINCLSFSRDGCKLFSGSWDHIIKIWDTSFDNPLEWNLKRTLVGHTDGVLCLSESPCGNYLASGGARDPTVRVWDVETGAELRVIKAHEDQVNQVKFSSGGMIVSTSTDGSAKLWNLAPRGNNAVYLGSAEDNAVLSIAVSKDGKTLVSGGRDKKVHVLDARTGKLRTSISGSKQKLFFMAVSGDGSLAISGSLTGKGSLEPSVRIWSLKNGEEKELKGVKAGDVITGITMAPDGMSFFASGLHGTLKQFGIETGELIMEFEHHSVFVRICAVTSDSKRIVSGADDGSIFSWDTETGKKIRTFEGHTSAVESVVLTPNDRNVVSGSGNGSAKLWDIDTGNLLHIFVGHTSSVESVAIHPSGEFLATGSKDKTWKLWSLQTKELLYTSHDSHTEWVNAVVFSPDGNYLISGSKDGTIKWTYVTGRFDHTTPFVHKMFLNELKGNRDIDWSASETMTALLEEPRAIVEPNYTSGRNLIHVAVSEASSWFLSRVLVVGGRTENAAAEGKMDLAERQKLAFFALMMKDSESKTPLAIALEMKSSSVVREIFMCLRVLFSQEYSVPFTKTNGAQEMHLQEHFAVSDICHALKTTPDLALSFIADLSLVNCGDREVSGEVKKIDFLNIGVDRLVSGSSTRAPHGYWKSVIEKMDDQDGINGDPVTAKICPFKGIASRDSEFLKSLVSASQTTRMLRAFESEVVMSVIDHKWNAYVRKMFHRHMYLDVAMVFCMTADALVFRAVHTEEHPSFKLSLIDHEVLVVLDYVLVAATICLWAFFACHEFRQYRNSEGILDHIKDRWNALDCISLFSIFAAYGLRMAEGLLGSARIIQGDGLESYTMSTIATSIALPFAYLNTLYYMQGFDRSSGELVRMIIGIIRGVRGFIFILGICLLGFAAGFFVLFEQNSNFNDISHDSPALSLLYSWQVMLNGFTVNEVDGSANYFVTALLFMFFTYFINIVMLNLLIAIMGDIFDRIQENAKAEFMFARANIILEFEALVSDSHKRNEEWFPTWLQVLVPTLENEEIEASNWTGRVRSIKKSISSVREEIWEENQQLKKWLEASERKRTKETQRLVKRLDQSEKEKDEVLLEVKEVKDMLTHLVSVTSMLASAKVAEMEGGSKKGGDDD